MIDFKSLNLHASILEALEKKGYTSPTPIQAQAIPHLLENKDLLGIAQTGTGKTAAFSLPIINRLGSNKIKVKPARMRTLILTPTRELASQIDENIKSYSKGLKLSSTVIFGGVSPRPQIMAMSKGVDILVATPGRLLDLMGDGHILFEQLEVFVLDEADRMLDMGFIRDIKKVIAKLPKVRQTLLFSATMPNDIADLANSLLKEPVRVEVTPESTTVEKIDQKLCLVDRTNKPLLLKSILQDKTIQSVLVFTRTKHGANRVVKHLEDAGIGAAAIHGNKSQGARERALDLFKRGKIRALVATDIAARGIDISNITHVVNYDLPNDPKSYVHRIGRTARAGREGVAISFCDETELKLLKDIEKTIKMKIDVDTTQPYHGAEPHLAKKQPLRNPNEAKGNKPKHNQNRRRKPLNKKASGAAPRKSN
ncbi:DEAD/DEAH box helicase [Bacteriovorax sp. Seq25_V]|uniref:DEAD/DEAH box helicase n=1 Tax=Bacteriovorax sp. Seq25_V TaxID=1201288 RepID=UPI00038A31CB|nr:DEAD/DEAH box helicase [Bacteriovorax sp. Seq25_V]EQC43690.1 DEAD/DEAH box helicase [Bacteriovorax sp. Seq25_V]